MRGLTLALALLCFTAWVASVAGAAQPDLDSVTSDPGASLDDGARDDATLSDADFRARLETLLQRIDKSSALTREQISANPGAPFLPDLHMQLGELIAQKADALYYLETERRKRLSEGAPGKNDDASKSDQVVRTIEEATQIFKMIDHDFPSYAKRPKVLLMLSSSYKMLHQTAAFKASAEKLFNEFPDTVEAARARILLAELYFDIEQYDECLSTLKPLLGSKFAYERDAAKYKSALVFLLQEKFRKSLDWLAEVARDPELDHPSSKAGTGQDILLGGGRLDLKREALKDSIRAFTQLYPHGELDPVGYYSELSPTEVYFQGVIEELAYRYISLREIRTGVHLFRVLCERLRQPQRVVRIYIDVFSKLTPEDRWGVEPTEVEYVLQDLDQWLTFYQLEPALKSRLDEFFERQVRELGTAAHDRAKPLQESPSRQRLLERAIRFYELYLSHFKTAKLRVKMALNLADAQYLLKRYKECGESYLRVYQNEFGPREQPETVIQNAILCLQSEKEEDFYVQVRSRGLLLKAIRSYVAFKPSLSKDPKIGFALLKAQYDQGYYSTTLDALYQFVRRFKNSPRAVSAGELLLDYYNTRSDLPGLKATAEKLLAVGVADSAFNTRLRTIRKQVALQRLYERVDTATANADSSRGENYLNAALATGDDAVKDVALQKALAASRSEGNVEVYLKTAGVLLAKERKPATRAELLTALASENLKLTRFYHALRFYEKLTNDPSLAQSDRDQAWTRRADLAVSLRDPYEVLKQLGEGGTGSLSKVSADLSNRSTTFLIELLEGRLRFPESVLPSMLKNLQSDDVRTAIYKLTPSLSSDARSQVIASIDAACGVDAKAISCAWLKLEQVEPILIRYVKELKTTTAGVDGLDAIAKRLEGITAQYGALDGAGDAHLETVRLIRLEELYAEFGAFLKRLAGKNPDLKTLLLQKAGEADASAAKSRDSCIAVARGSTSPASNYCAKSSPPPAYSVLLHVPVGDDLSWEKGQDPSSRSLEALEKKRFVDSKNPDVLLSLGSSYLGSDKFAHAMATALLGESAFPEHAGDFEAICACAARGLRLTREAVYHLKKASDYAGLKAKCAGGRTR